MDWIHILELLGCILGGAGITELINYFVTIKSKKAKAEHEAEEAGVDVAQKTFAMSKDQSEYLIEKLNQYQKDYYTLNDEYRERVKGLQSELDTVEREFSDKINSKCIEITNLKSEITYLKGLRCYNSGCMVRVTKNPDKSKKENDNN